MSAWVKHIKEFAKSKGIAYGKALSDPECKSSYHANKGKGLEAEATPVKEEAKPEVKPETTEEVKPKRKGRPPKYLTAEERAEAKKVKTVESNKRRGKGLTVQVKAEADNGLGHIYPITHENVVAMCKHLV